MPNLIDLLLDPTSIVIYILYAGLILWEAIRPARLLPKIPYWRVKGFLAFGGYFVLSSYVPFLWSDLLAPLRLTDLSSLPTWAGAAIAVVIYEALAYWYHRAMHTVPVLWRIFHQAHHSAERLDTWSAFWFSPWDTVGFTLMFSLAVTIVGFSAESTVWAVWITTFLAVFQHANISTPEWLGYIIQRPESHSLHHGRDVHFGNFADVPVFDMMFGTFTNPKDFVPETGFYQGASSRYFEMILGVDVTSK